jgi:hypothetical protein
VRKLLRLSTTIFVNLLQQRMLRWSTHTTAYITADTSTADTSTTHTSTAYTSSTYTSTTHTCTAHTSTAYTSSSHSLPSLAEMVTVRP